MIRQMKAVGSALVAVLAVAAMTASAVQAESNSTFTVFPTGTNVVLSGTHENGKHQFAFTEHPVAGGFATASCETHLKGVGTITDNFQSATFEPIYTNCTAFGLNATTSANGCHYEITLGTTTGVNSAHVKKHFRCPEGKKIVIVAATCEIVIGAQEALGAGEMTNAGTVTEMDITLDTSVSGIKYTVTKDGIGCPLSGTGSFTKGDYTGATTFTAVHNITGVTARVTIH